MITWQTVYKQFIELDSNDFNTFDNTQKDIRLLKVIANLWNATRVHFHSYARRSVTDVHFVQLDV